MAALATLVQLEARLGGPAANAPRALALLDDASAAAREYCGQDFERLPRAAEVWPNGCCFTLSGKDIDTVAATFEANPVTLTQIGRHEWRSSVCKGPLDVTYTAGWATVPAAVVAVVCSMTARALALDPAQLAVQQEVTGPFSVSIGGAAASGAVGMLEGERKALKRYVVTPQPIRAGTWADGLVTSYCSTSGC